MKYLLLTMKVRHLKDRPVMLNVEKIQYFAPEFDGNGTMISLDGGEHGTITVRETFDNIRERL